MAGRPRAGRGGRLTLVVAVAATLAPGSADGASNLSELVYREDTQTEFTLQSPWWFPAAWPASELEIPLRVEAPGVRAEELSLWVLQPTGALRAPFQLSARQSRPDGSLASARLHTFLALPPGDPLRFVLARRTPAAEVDSPAERERLGWIEAVPLRELLAGGDRIVESARWKVRIPGSRPAAEGEPFPGPLEFLGPGGEPLCRSTLAGGPECLELRAEVVEDGDLLRLYRLTYRFRGGGRYRVDIRCVAGSPFVEFREEMEGFPEGRKAPEVEFQWEGLRVAGDVRGEAGDSGPELLGPFSRGGEVASEAVFLAADGSQVVWFVPDRVAWSPALVAAEGADPLWMRLLAQVDQAGLTAKFPLGPVGENGARRAVAIALCRPGERELWMREYPAAYRVEGDPVQPDSSWFSFWNARWPLGAVARFAEGIGGPENVVPAAPGMLTAAWDPARLVREAWRLGEGKSDEGWILPGSARGDPAVMEHWRLLAEMAVRLPRCPGARDWLDRARRGVELAVEEAVELEDPDRSWGDVPLAADLGSVLAILRHAERAGDLVLRATGADPLATDAWARQIERVSGLAAVAGEGGAVGVRFLLGDEVEPGWDPNWGSWGARLFRVRPRLAERLFSLENALGQTADLKKETDYYTDIEVRNKTAAIPSVAAVQVWPGYGVVLHSEPEGSYRWALGWGPDVRASSGGLLIWRDDSEWIRNQESGLFIPSNEEKQFASTVRGFRAVALELGSVRSAAGQGWSEPESFGAPQRRVSLVGSSYALIEDWCPGDGGRFEWTAPPGSSLPLLAPLTPGASVAESADPPAFRTRLGPQPDGGGVAHSMVVGPRRDTRLEIRPKGRPVVIESGQSEDRIWLGPGVRAASGSPDDRSGLGALAVVRHFREGGLEWILTGGGETGGEPEPAEAGAEGMRMRWKGRDGGVALRVETPAEARGVCAAESETAVWLAGDEELHLLLDGREIAEQEASAESGWRRYPVPAGEHLWEIRLASGTRCRVVLREPEAVEPGPVGRWPGEVWLRREKGVLFWEFERPEPVPTGFSGWADGADGGELEVAFDSGQPAHHLSAAEWTEWIAGADGTGLERTDSRIEGPGELEPAALRPADAQPLVPDWPQDRGGGWTIHLSGRFDAAGRILTAVAEAGPEFTARLELDAEGKLSAVVGSGNWACRVVAGPGVTDGEWHELVWTVQLTAPGWHGTAGAVPVVARLFVDGVLEGEGSGYAAAPARGRIVWGLGRTVEGAANGFSGAVKAVRLGTRPLEAHAARLVSAAPWPGAVETLARAIPRELRAGEAWELELDTEGLEGAAGSAQLPGWAQVADGRLRLAPGEEEVGSEVVVHWPGQGGAETPERDVRIRVLAPLVTEDFRLFVDGEKASVERLGDRVRFRVPAGRRRIEFTDGKATPLAPQIAGWEGTAEGARVWLRDRGAAENWEWELSEDAGITWRATGSTRVPELLLGGVAFGRKYWVRAAAGNAFRTGPFSAPEPVYLSRQTPPPPAGLRVQPGRDRALASWGEVAGASVYRLYRRVRGTERWDLVYEGPERRYLDANALGVAPPAPMPGGDGPVHGGRGLLVVFEYAVTAGNGMGEGGPSPAEDTDPRRWIHWLPPGWVRPLGESL